MQAACSFLGKHKVSLERALLAPGVFSQLCRPGSCPVCLHLHRCSLRAQSLVLQVGLPLLRAAGPRTTAQASWPPRLPLPEPSPHLGPHFSAFQFITFALSIPVALFAGARVWGARLWGTTAAQRFVYCHHGNLPAGLGRGLGRGVARAQRGGHGGPHPAPGFADSRQRPGSGSTCALGLVEAAGPWQAAQRW